MSTNDFVIENGVLIEYNGSEKDVVIPDGVTAIGDVAFFKCDLLESIKIPESVTSVGNGAFEGCKSLKNITIPDCVTTIGEGAFAYCESLENISIPDSVTDIGGNSPFNGGAFTNCASLKSVTIGKSVVNIPKYVFLNCTSLTNIEIRNGVQKVFRKAFYNCSSLRRIIFPDSIIDINKEAFLECPSLSEIVVTDGNTKYSSLDGVLFNKKKTRLIKYPAGKTEKVYVIPESVTSIADVAFDDCKGLTICGSIGSAAQDYVNEYGVAKRLRFKTLDSAANSKKNTAHKSNSNQLLLTDLSSLNFDGFKGKGFILADDCSSDEKTILKSILKRYGASIKKAFSNNVDYFISSCSNMKKMKTIPNDMQQAIEQYESTGKPLLINSGALLNKASELVSDKINSMTKEERFNYAISLYKDCTKKIDKLMDDGYYNDPICSEDSRICSQLMEGAQIADASDFLRKVAGNDDAYKRYYSLYEKAFETRGCSLGELCGTDFAIALCVACFVYGSPDCDVFVEWVRDKWELRGDYSSSFRYAFTISSLYPEGDIYKIKYRKYSNMW